MSREEIVGALKTLQDCCRTHKRCENCPLRNEPARCGVTSASPNMWRFAELPSEWKPFEKEEGKNEQ